MRLSCFVVASQFRIGISSGSKVSAHQNRNSTTVANGVNQRRRSSRSRSRKEPLSSSYQTNDSLYHERERESQEQVNDEWSNDKAKGKIQNTPHVQSTKQKLYTRVLSKNLASSSSRSLFFCVFSCCCCCLWLVGKRATMMSDVCERQSVTLIVTYTTRREKTTQTKLADRNITANRRGNLIFVNVSLARYIATCHPIELKQETSDLRFG